MSVFRVVLLALVVLASSDDATADGFRIAVYADPVPNARAMALGARGTVFAGSRQAGKVYAIVDGDGDGRAEGIRTPRGRSRHARRRAPGFGRRTRRDLPDHGGALNA